MSERLKSLKHWLNEVLDSSDYKLKPASEDASFRSYYRLFIDNNTFIVMDAPPPQEDCAPFVQVTTILLASDVNAPTIHQMDLKQGFLLLDDFGNDLYLNKLDANTANQLYSDAIKALVRMQSSADVNDLPLYDEALLRREMQLFSEWLLGKHLELELSDAQNKSIAALFDLLVENALEQPQSFVHRDFHSRNLMITADNNPGVIDYQDAVHGPITYDLVSLLKDCYIKWSKDEIDKWVDLYLQQQAEKGAEINRQKFQRWFDLMGVQRHLKASGIFARLSHRDGKHGYLNDITRTLSYIVDLKQDYSELAALCLLIEASVLPKFEAVS
ncbi:MAG TPA: aminoglycoside phosphotransferase [Thiotrichaceae bacterium]|jgi:aminoglycoside/choline kinase family phosphotransferase|nr:aminoglycoside phosphotransferase [Thiotrichaceae bacterium]HIM07584.1 aminoglycoside phosphotransferase [Gammaproteobacteria bacterium]